MTTDDERSIDDVFNEVDIISRYSDRQAVADGILFDVGELRKLSPRIPWDRGPFQYVTTNLCSKGYVKDDGPSVPNFLDLFRTMEEYMRNTGPDDFYDAVVEFPDGSTGTVYAERNMSGRYTIMLPEDR